MSRNGLRAAFPPIDRVARAKRGERRQGLRHVQAFLERFGYLAGPYEPERLDEPTSRALASYQRRYGRRATGTFNPATREQMLTPRCGNADVGPPVALPAAFAPAAMAAPAAAECRWQKDVIKFSFDGGTVDLPADSELPEDIEFEAVRKAFRVWEAQIPLQIREAQPEEQPDIVVGWRLQEAVEFLHGGAIGHSDSPPACSPTGDELPKRIFLNETERWSLSQGVRRTVDVQTAALHEIGHALGLQHSVVENSVMFEVDLRGRRNLASDDIQRIQALYA